MPRPIAWLTPNRLVAICRVVLIALLVTALIAGPEGFGNAGLRFAVAYGMTIVALPALPRFGGRDIAGTIALLLGARWAFSPIDAEAAQTLLTQLAGVASAIAPIYARNVGRLAGSSEGHISFTERRAMWRRSAASAPRQTAPAAQTSSPSHVETVALLDYHPNVGG